MKASELQIGVITGTHGIRGLVKVMPVSDDPARFAQIGAVTAVTVDSRRIELEIQQARPHKGQMLIAFKGLDRIELAEPLKGAALFVDREHAAPLEENEYYYADLTGMKVVSVTDGKEEPLGILTDIMQTGANDVYIVRTESGHEVLIPSIHDCILSVDIDNGLMKVRLLPGMEV